MTNWKMKTLEVRASSWWVCVLCISGHTAELVRVLLSVRGLAQPTGSAHLLLSTIHLPLRPAMPPSYLCLRMTEQAEDTKVGAAGSEVRGVLPPN